MTLTQVIYLLIIIVLWALQNKYLSLQKPFQTGVNVVVGITLIVWLLGIFGIINPIIHF